MCATIALAISSLAPGLVYAKKEATMQEVVRPTMMTIDGDKLFIVDGHSILIYSMENYTLLKKFGKAGEGPQEFLVNYRNGPGMMVFPTPKFLLVNTDNKLFHFTRDGEYIKEQRAPLYAVFMPLSSGYTANGFGPDEENHRVLTVNLHDPELNRVKELFVSNRVLDASIWEDLPKNPFYFLNYKDRTYVLAVKYGFCIIVFDQNGKELYRIKKDEPKLKVTDEFKKRALYWGKNESHFKEFFDPSRFTFKKYFPAIQEIMVSDDRIYAFTFKKKGDDTECVVMDLKGKELKRIYLPMPYKTPIGYTLPSTFFGHKFYRLLDNQEKETWELHAEEVK
jgi:hypothetical protein